MNISDYYKITVVSAIFSTLLLMPCVSSASFNANILLITIDTLRADHLGCYGYTKVKTPHIDSVAREGILFENAFTSVPITLPSHISIFTGCYPHYHGIRNNGTYALSESATTCAEIFKQKGYTTAAFVSSFVLDRRFGLDQGFDVYNDNLISGVDAQLVGKERRAKTVTESALRWLGTTGSNKFFLWVHYYDPHDAYMPPAPYSEMYANNLYDGEIAYTDKWVGVLLEEFKKRGIYENTLIIIVADHGEGLGDHGESTHGIFIYDYALKVPFICSYAKFFPSARRIDSIVRLIDIAPTLLGIAGIDPISEMQGTSLLPFMAGKEKKKELSLYCETLYPRFTHNWSPLFGVRKDSWKYIEAPSPELYNMKVDPQENNNLFTKKPAIAAELQTQLRSLKNGPFPEWNRSQEHQLSTEEKEKLRSLGYVFAPSENKKESYPDPKTMIKLMKYMDEGAKYFAQGAFKKAIAEYKKVIKEYPQDTDAYTILATIYEAMGENEKAIESLEKAIELESENIIIYNQLGINYMKAGRFSDGLRVFNHVLTLNPRCEEAYLNMGLYHFQKGELTVATDFFNKVLELDPDDTASRSYLVAIYQKQGKYVEAIAECKNILKRDPHNNTALFNLGATYVTLNNFSEAKTYFIKSLEINSAFDKAHYYLGFIYVQENNLDKAIESFSEAVRLNPNYTEAHFSLGSIYKRRGNYDKAIDEFKAALSINPNFIQAQQMLEEMKWHTH
ncbi:MAG: tetratricopeptide repeat protein [bacterium]